MRLLFISNLFPDTTQPWRGLDNVTLLHAMRAKRPEAEIRALCLRPGHGFWLGKKCAMQAREQDVPLAPSFHWAAYLPKLGGMNDRLYALSLQQALKGLGEWKPEALLVPWLFPDASGVHRVSSLKALPLVGVAQGSDVHQYLKLPMRRRAILDLAKRATVITRSEDLRQRILRAGACQSAVHTVYNGVDLTQFYPGEKTAVRRTLALPESGRMLLFVGNFLPVKGLDLLIQAVAKAGIHFQEPLRLVMIGSGPLKEKLSVLAKQCGLGSDALIWAGRRAPAEVAQFMRAADAVCLTSHNEGVPNVLLEALASGRPLISTHVGGISEILDPSPAGGQLVTGREVNPFADAICKTLNHLPDHTKLHEYACKFAWEKCAEAYWRLLESKH